MAASMRRVSIVWFVALALALSLIGTLAVPVRAASITVNTTADEDNTDGDCSLREAIKAATTNAAADACPAGELTPDTITVPAGTYVVSLNLMVGDSSIDQEIIIAGAGAATTIVDGGDATRVFRIFGGDVTLSGLTVQRGSVIGGLAGGGIIVEPDANLDLTNATVTDNHASGGSGGGIFVDGDLDVSGSTISGNTADEGGGIYLNGGADSAFDTSVVSGNSAGDGGGIYSETGDLEITESSIINNDANYDAQADNGGDGGGIWSAGDTSLTNTTVSGNDAAVDGGGLYVDDDFKSVPVLEIEASTVSGNSALGAGDTEDLEDGNGGGIWADADVFLLNSTVSGNDAVYTGGGIFLQDNALRSDFATIASNTASATDEPDSGGGIYNVGGDVDLYATIVANNTATDCGVNDASIDTLGNNLDSDDTCDLNDAVDSPDHPAGEAGLAALASNGGLTQTHALLFNSDAIDAVVGPDLANLPEFLLAGALTLCPPAADQRGATVGPRPADGNGDGTAVCDIGAFELQPPSASINDVNVIEGNSGTTPATFTVTLSHGYGGTVSFSWATANGTATAPADYQSANGSVSFAPGETTRPITVQVVGDTVDEDNETFTVNLSAPVNGTIADGQGLGTIIDDEGPIVTPTPAAGQLPNTGTGDAGLGGWGGPGLAIGLVAVSAAAWLQARRRFARAR